MQASLRLFLPLLFALAQRHQLPDPEEAVHLALQDICTFCACWEKSGLPAHVWVAGIARQRFKTLGSSTLTVS
ncbi:hypothetical protein [Deinococcus hopiensis]|uniref:hypothetical protein n=1 Tax=Deinococcus hopiensis TaxID=309885 RepID=UPI00111C4DE8|nr:hypothetical protein [Deinococcus hopiensis]